MRISLQAELGDFQDRHTIYVFALKMSFLAVTLSSVVVTLVLPLLDWIGMLPVPLADGLVYGVLLSWLIGGAVASVLSLVAGHALHQLSVSRAEFEQLSRTDVLSGLLNRRAFSEALEQVDGDACLAIFDVDRFKAINDRFGHASGDAVIVTVSAILAAAFDGSSVAARLGGEEFGVIVVGGSQEQRVERVRSVCDRLAAHPIVTDDCVVALTVSAGIAELEPGRSKEGAYSSADKALYLAKALGRNRVVHENEGLHPGWRRHLPVEPVAVRATTVDCDEARLA